jgi:hypothetical protein
MNAVAFPVELDLRRPKFAMCLRRLLVSGQPCQKQPSTKTTSFSRRITRSPYTAAQRGGGDASGTADRGGEERTAMPFQAWCRTYSRGVVGLPAIDRAIPDEETDTRWQIAPPVNAMKPLVDSRSATSPSAPGDIAMQSRDGVSVGSAGPSALACRISRAAQPRDTGRRLPRAGLGSQAPHRVR